MRVAVFTLNNKQNYGGILQCLAMQNIIKEMGHEVDVIRFKYSIPNSYIRKLRLFFSLYGSFNGIITFINDSFRELFYIKTYPVTNEMLRGCEQFIRENINYTELVNEFTIGELAQKYDAIVIGSDKVWGGLGKKYLTYLFDWTPEYKGLRISYAACSSLKSIPKYNKQKAKNCFDKFDALSVRDIHTQRLVRKVSDLEPTIVVDPTLLYDFKDFISSPIFNEPYIFTYILGDDIKGKGGYKTVMQSIKKRFGDIKIVAVVIADVSLFAEKFADYVFYDASPCDWLNFIYHAKFIYTDSFHGCIFSLKYKKEFIGYYSNSNRSSRMKDLAIRYGLEENIISSTRYLPLTIASIDYNKIDTLIQVHNNHSRDFLAKILV